MQQGAATEHLHTGRDTPETQARRTDPFAQRHSTPLVTAHTYPLVRVTLSVTETTLGWRRTRALRRPGARRSGAAQARPRPREQQGPAILSTPATRRAPSLPHLLSTAHCIQHTQNWPHGQRAPKNWAAARRLQPRPMTSGTARGATACAATSALRRAGCPPPFDAHPAAPRSWEASASAAGAAAGLPTRAREQRAFITWPGLLGHHSLQGPSPGTPTDPNQPQNGARLLPLASACNPSRFWLALALSSQSRLVSRCMQQSNAAAEKGVRQLFTDTMLRPPLKHPSLGRGPSARSRCTRIRRAARPPRERQQCRPAAGARRVFFNALAAHPSSAAL